MGRPEYARGEYRQRRSSGRRASGRTQFAISVIVVSVLLTTGCSAGSFLELHGGRAAWPGRLPVDEPATPAADMTGMCAHRHEPERLGLALAPAGPDGSRPFAPSPYGEQPVNLYPVLGPPQSTWEPTTPLPHRSPAARGMLVVYTPHPDDETLSMGALISNAVQAHEQVIIVALTDGRTTRADDKGAQQLGQAQVAAARDLELKRAAAALGVPSDDVVFAHMDAPSSGCGPVLTVHEAEAVMRTVSAHYPGALDVTMSFTAERNQDHLDAGYALEQLNATRVIAHAAWTVSRLWWQLPTPSWSWVLPVDPAARASVIHAARQYDVLEPHDGQYAIGWTSVPEQFHALMLDIRNKLHTRT